MSVPSVEPPEIIPENSTLPEPSVPSVESPEIIPENSTIPEPSPDASLYNPGKDLFRAAMNRKWYRVCELYSENKKVQGEHITRANDTLLHIAVSGATEKIILDLLGIVEENEEMSNILNLQNNAGDTPLHLAAALGLEKVCREMTIMCPDMITKARNNLQETPLFSAVRHGKKNTFFVLEAAIHKKQELTIDEVSLSSRDITHCRRDDGNNILHLAIKGEQLDLAYEIIFLYPKLTDYVNSKGETALHTLANKPSVFKSGARFGLYDTILYHCTITEPLTFEFVDFLENEKNNMENKSENQEDEKKVLPPIYTVCVDLFSLMKESIKCISNIVASNLKTGGIWKAGCADEENQSGAKKEDEDKASKNQKQIWWIPPNYDIMIFFFKIIVKLLLVVSGIERRLQTIAKLKQKHRDAVTIMKELVDRSTLWEYEEASGGQQPFHDIDFSASPPDFESISPPSVPNTDLGLPENTPNQSEEDSLHFLYTSFNQAVKEDTYILKNVLEKGFLKIVEEIKAIKEGTDILQKVLEKGSLKIVEEKESTHRPDTASPVLVAAKRGITEMVKRILDQYPVAVKDKDKDRKNIVLLAVEHRQVHVYTYMLGVETIESVFQQVDKDENSALHLAAMLSHNRPWSIPGAALQMQWESKWYKYVQSMNLEIFSRINKDGKTAEEVFIESHDALVKDGSTWLTNTSQSCSVVAALVATVAFASASTVPGGVEQQSGVPVLSRRPAFQLFAISSLVALCFSVTSLVMFLAILTSRYEVRDFNRGLPVKLILGLASLFMGIASMLVAFCAGDFFVVENKLKFALYPIYAIMCFPVTFFAAAQFPLYIDLIKLAIKKVPERTAKVHMD